MSSLKDSLTGIVILGVLSSLLASYIWDRTHGVQPPTGQVNTAAPAPGPDPGNTPQPVPSDALQNVVPLSPRDGVAAASAGGTGTAAIHPVSTRLDSGNAETGSDTASGPSETPLPPSDSPIPRRIAFLSLPAPEDFRNLFPAAASGFKGFREGRPLGKSGNGHKIWASSVTLNHAEGCQISEKPGFMEYYLGTADKDTVDQRFTVLSGSVRELGSALYVQKASADEQIAEFQPPGGPLVVIWTQSTGAGSDYALFARMTSTK